MVGSVRFLRIPNPLQNTVYTGFRRFSVLNRPPPKYKGHVPLALIERGALAAGSAVLALMNPSRSGKPA